MFHNFKGTNELEKQLLGQLGRVDKANDENEVSNFGVRRPPSFLVVVLFHALLFGY
jgi:hypothetical protein